VTLPFLTPLNITQLRSADIPEPWAYGVADKVRFGELDALGHVNNVAYMSWFEVVRIHYFRDYGLSDYKSADRPRLVLANATVTYKAEMHLGQIYIVAARTAQFGNTSFTMNYAVYGETLYSSGSAVIVQLNQDGTKRALSDPLKDKMVRIDGATPR
jgi:acyl-CoA thioester hydrolase